jgi:hypothetical protein
MGLDTYAGRTPVDFFDPELDENEVDEEFGCTRLDRWALRRLQRRRERANDGYCLFGSNYFRGKLYDDLVRHVTSFSLYATWTPPETVAKMADAFERRDPESALRDFRAHGRSIYEHSVHEYADLCALFRLCADRGLGLVGSW